MKTRILTSIVLILILIIMCIFAETDVFSAGLAIVTLIGVYEMLDCTKMKKNPFIAVPLYIAAVAAPFLMRHFRGEFFSHLPKLIISMLLFVLYILTVIVFSNGKLDIGEVLAAVMLSLYIIGALTCIMYVRDLENGGYYWIFAFIGAWITDIFAYFTGRFFGKHKLIPEISPKKTVEGSIGGTVFCVLGFVVYAVILRECFNINVNILICSITGFVSAIVSQIGDLSMSAIKRHYGIKDFGNILPGHGGILDRFDSIMAVAVVLAIFSTRATPFM